MTIEQKNTCPFCKKELLRETISENFGQIYDAVIRCFDDEHEYACFFKNRKKQETILFRSSDKSVITYVPIININISVIKYYDVHNKKHKNLEISYSPIDSSTKQYCKNILNLN